MSNEPLLLPDERTRGEISSLLKLIAPNLAAFFEDACFLIENRDSLKSVTHLVAHLLREIESGLRAAFRTRDRKKSNSSNRHKEEIKQICRALRIEDSREENLENLWLSISGELHHLAHRDSLNPTRPFSEIEQVWKYALDLLKGLDKPIRGYYYRWKKEAEDLAAKDSPTGKDADYFVQNIPNNAFIHRHFFLKLKNPKAWFLLLENAENAKSHVFDRPPEPYEPQPGVISFPYWPEADYLKQMAPIFPGKVAEIIANMNTDNVSVQGGMLNALTSMPPTEALAAADKALEWARRPVLYLPLPSKLMALAVHLAGGDECCVGKALELAEAVFDVLEYDESDSLVGYRKYRTRIDYDPTFWKCCSELARRVGLPALELLCRLLDKALSLSGESYSGGEDGSIFWCRDFSEERGNELVPDIEEALSLAVKETAELLVREEKASLRQVVAVLRKRRWKVFERLVLHLYGTFPDEAEDELRRALTDRRIFDDSYLRREYARLIREHFRRLDPESRALVLGWIEDGPDLDLYRKFCEQHTGKLPSEEEEHRYAEEWRHKRLSWFDPADLPDEERAALRQMDEKYGKPEHPEYLFPPPEVKTLGHESPLSPEKILAMSHDELTTFLREWEPAKDLFEGPTVEGLCFALKTAAGKEPGRFARAAATFEGLPPAYGLAVVQGLSESLNRNAEFEWEPVLRLCSRLVEEVRDSAPLREYGLFSERDPRSKLSSISSLLLEGLDKRFIPFSSRERVWDIIHVLLETLSGFSIDMLPWTFRVVFVYARWVRDNLEGGGASRHAWFDEMPEVREVLDAYLDPGREGSVAARPVYGEYFPDVLGLDSAWAKQNANRIFPRDEESRDLFYAAWDAYLSANSRYSPSVFDVLSKCYSLVADDMGSSAARDENLAAHVMTLYWSGKIGLDHSLSKAFWRNAPEGIRAHALISVGRALEIQADIAGRLKELWDFRLAEAEKDPAGHREEMSVFAHWFASGKFDPEWSLDRLKRASEIAEGQKDRWIVFRPLEQAFEKFPLEVLECLEKLFPAQKGAASLQWELHRDSVRRILEKALSSASAEVREKAAWLINCFGTLGYEGFEDLLEREE